MGEPRVMLGINTLRNRKLTELPSDRARVAWFDLLFEAKTQKPEGTFASLNQVKLLAKHRRDTVQALLDAGLLHAAPALCDRCKRRFGEVGPLAVVIHDWQDFQEPSRWTKWRADQDAPAPDRAPTDAPDVHPPRTIDAPDVAPISAPSLHPPRGRARASVSPSVSTSSSESNGSSAQYGEPEGPVLIFLASVGATVVPDGNGFHRRLVKLVDRHDAETVIAAMERRYQSGERSDRQLIFGAENDLEQIHRPDSKAKPKGHQVDEEEAIRAFKSA